MISYKWIGNLFPAPGYFIEAGAHDCIGDSQTYALEQQGWDGICVEPSSAFRGLKRSRKCKVDSRCLWSVDGDTIDFREVRGNGVELSGIANQFYDAHDRTDSDIVSKQTITLPTLLLEHNAPKIIEWLSLDTEGSEFAILSAHDFDRFQFQAITVEHNQVVTQRNKIRQLLFSKGYVLGHAQEIEDWYVKDTLGRKL